MQPAAQPQGIEAILAALQGGGMPNGNMANLPSPVNPQTGLTSLDPQAASAALPTGGSPLPNQSSGAIDPLAAAGMGDLDPALLQMIIQALTQGGAFNQGPPVLA